MQFLNVHFVGAVETYKMSISEGVSMDTFRIIEIYGIYSFIAILFIFLGTKVLRRNKANRVNQMFSLCFFTTGGGLLINLIYAPLTDPVALVFLNLLTTYFACLGLVFLLVGVAIIYKSNTVVTDRKKEVVIIAYAIALVVFFFIPDNATVNLSDYSIIWGLGFIIYGICVTQVVFGATLVLSGLFLKTFEDRAFKIRFLQFIVGLFLLDYILVQNFLLNGLIWPRSIIFTLISLLVIPAAILLYNGIIKQTSD